MQNTIIPPLHSPDHLVSMLTHRHVLTPPESTTTPTRRLQVSTRAPHRDEDTRSAQLLPVRQLQVRTHDNADPFNHRVINPGPIEPVQPRMHPIFARKTIKTENCPPQRDEFLVVSVPMSAGGSTGDRQVSKHLNVGDEAREFNGTGDVTPRAFAQPVRLRPDELVVPPHDRVRGMLGIDDAREPPQPKLAPIQIGTQIGRLVNEAHSASVMNDGGNLGAALVTSIRGL